MINVVYLQGYTCVIARGNGGVTESITAGTEIGVPTRGAAHGGCMGASVNTVAWKYYIASVPTHWPREMHTGVARTTQSVRKAGACLAFEHGRSMKRVRVAQ